MQRKRMKKIRDDPVLHAAHKKRVNDGAMERRMEDPEYVKKIEADPQQYPFLIQLLESYRKDKS